MKQILIFGDSNTWGFDPVTRGRHPFEVRWPGILTKLLGDGYLVAERGLTGRTTVFDNPYFPCRNGLKALPYALVEHMSTDLLIISLGTNDLKYTNAQGAAAGIGALLREVKHTISPGPVPILAPGGKILVISPIRLAEDIAEKRPETFPVGAYEQSCLFLKEYETICRGYGVELLDAAAFAAPSVEDCIHMDAENHRRLAYAVYDKIKALEANDTKEN